MRLKLPLATRPLAKAGLVAEGVRIFPALPRWYIRSLLPKVLEEPR
jgi:hypothetical protein